MSTTIEQCAQLWAELEAEALVDSDGIPTVMGSDGLPVPDFRHHGTVGVLIGVVRLELKNQVTLQWGNGWHELELDGHACMTGDGTCVGLCLDLLRVIRQVNPVQPLAEVRDEALGLVRLVRRVDGLVLSVDGEVVWRDRERRQTNAPAPPEAPWEDLGGSCWQLASFDGRYATASWDGARAWVEVNQGEDPIDAKAFESAEAGPGLRDARVWAEDVLYQEGVREGRAHARAEFTTVPPLVRPESTDPYCRGFWRGYDEVEGLRKRGYTWVPCGHHHGRYGCTQDECRYGQTDG